MSRIVRRLVPYLAAVAMVVPQVASATDVTDLPIAQTLTFAQLSQPVDVVRDNLGIPHVYASTLNDAAFVLGYIHASERMFQMDMFRRIPSGTVSEVLGFPDFQIGSGPDPTVPPFPGNISNLTQDLFFQTLGLRRAAVDSFNALSPSVQSALQSYADGVNEYITLANVTGNLPAEYGLLHVTQIAPWTPVDSVVFGKLQAFQLSFDFDDGPTGDLKNLTDTLGPTGETAYYEDLARARPEENAFTVPDASNVPIPLSALTVEKTIMLARGESNVEASVAKPAPRKVGSQNAGAAVAKAPAAPRRVPSAAQRKAVASARKATITKAREYIAQLMQQPAMRAIRERGTVGSNEWGVDGTVTDSGHPILANDPHLGLGSPPTFYELHVNTKDRGGNLNVTGIGFAGAPGVVQGHNENIAWGSTTNPADVTDWYLEDVSSDGAGNLFSHYLGNPEPITKLPLVVKVNAENGNVTGFERNVLASALGLNPFQQLPPSPIDVSALLANFVPTNVLVVPRHGPIFPQTLEPFPFPASHSGGSALSIQFTGLYPTRELETFFVWNAATNLTQFKSGLQFFDFGSQNWGYADTAGNLAYFASGEFPVREDIDAGAVSGNPPWVIRNGTGGNEWKALGGPQPAGQAVPYEVVPPAEVPQIENPPAHFFVNANNDPIGNTADNDPLDEPLAGTAPYLSRGYDEFRAARITEMIKSELNLIPTPPGTPAGDGVISFADMQRMQADVNQLEGRRLAKYFVTAVDDAQGGGAPPQLAALVNPKIIDARNRLNAWTFNTPAGFNTAGDPGVPTPQDLINSVATTIYNVAVGRLVVNTFDAALAASSVGYRPGDLDALRGLMRLLDAVPFTGVGASGINFFNDTTVSLTAAQERDMLLVKSLQGALDLLSGPSFVNAYASSVNVDDYLWGKVHYLIFQSFIDGDLNDTRIAGGGAFSIPTQPAPYPPGFPADGARFTVDVASYGIRPTQAASLSFGSGANRRSVVQMAPGAIVAKNVIPGGENGEPGRPHYGDQVDLWLGNGYHDALLTTADVVAAAAARENYPTFGGCTVAGPGRCIPGKGSPKTDCSAEVLVDAPATPENLAKAQITLTDGGSADFDESANGTCVVHLFLCLNNTDPRIVDNHAVQCQSADVNLFELKKPRPDAKKVVEAANGVALMNAARALGASVTIGDHGSILDYGPAVTAQNVCAPTYLRVPLKKPGVKGKQTFKILVTRSDGQKDTDTIKVTCNP